MFLTPPNAFFFANIRTTLFMCMLILLKIYEGQENNVYNDFIVRSKKFWARLQITLQFICISLNNNGAYGFYSILQRIQTRQVGIMGYSATAPKNLGCETIKRGKANCLLTDDCLLSNSE